MPISPPAINTSTAVATLASQFYWAPGNITYSIPVPGSSWPGYAAGTEPFDVGYAALSAAQATQFRLAIQKWDELISRSFSEVVEPAGRGDIRVAFTTMTGQNANAWGYASFPPFQGGAAGSAAGDIWIDRSVAGNSFAAGTYDFQATLHEIGHALGLNHPFESNPPLPAQYDNYRYSIMSYTAPADGVRVIFSAQGGGIQYTTSNVVSVTPTVFDIAAIQSMYGADTATRSGDSVYSWSESAAQLEVVYDAGGIDTFDLSSHSRASSLDLRPGAYSSIAIYSKAAQIEAAVALFGEGFRQFISNNINTPATYTWENNVGIALNTTIENVLLGSGNDTVVGNNANNRISGNNGNDSLFGDTGADTLDGGLGSDTLDGGAGADSMNGGDGVDLLSYASSTSGAGILFYMLAPNLNGGDAAGDIYALFENLTGTSANDRIYMDNGANSVEGGGGFDTVELYGGNDSYLGGTGFDYVLAGAGNDVITVGDGGSLIYGEDGDDAITATAGSNEFNGGIGNDTLTGGTGQDVILGGAGLDSILGGSGDDFLFGEDGNDTISGDAGNDQIQGGIGLDSLAGGANVDVIQGGADNDNIDGGSEDDFLFGEAGNDTVLGGAGNDQVFGGTENDSLVGNAGIDILNGGDGNDTLNDGGTGELTFSIGGNGNDTIFGTSGQDQMWGGTGSVDTGSDVFVFGAGNGYDIIFDFQAGAGIVDQIRLVGTGIASFAQLQAENRIGQAGANTQINLIGAGNVIFLINTTAATLVADDFLFA